MQKKLSIKIYGSVSDYIFEVLFTFRKSLLELSYENLF